MPLVALQSKHMINFPKILLAQSLMFIQADGAVALLIIVQWHPVVRLPTGLVTTIQLLGVGMGEQVARVQMDNVDHPSEPARLMSVAL